MKKILPFAVLGLLALASCKKTSSPAITTTNTITATVDGVPDTFIFTTGSETFLDSTGEDLWYSYEAFAYDSNHNQLRVVVEELNKAISNKIYGTQGDSTTNATIAFYTDYDYWGSRTKLNPATITITSNGGGNVQGTFQGTVYEGNDTTSANKKVITNGKFNITAL
ncbi:MAG TPA: hypothetical protein VK718_06690 [Ferruginibacter sp.]|nr:hypothetical protein [Ferruginibacter sp.]